MTGGGPVSTGTYRQYGVGEDRLQLLWTPYRMSYIAETRPEPAEGMTGEPFLDIPQMSDEDGLVVARGEHVYVVLNLYPYNPGHSMVVPYRKVADLEDLDDDEARELMSFTQHLLRVIKAVSNLRTPASTCRATMDRRRQLHHRDRWYEGVAAVAQADPSAAR